MRIWIMIALGALGLGAFVMTALFVLRETRPVTQLTFPHPSTSSFNSDFICFDPSDGRSPERNARDAYEFYVAALGQLSTANPLRDQSGNLSADGIDPVFGSVEDIFDTVENQYGCRIEINRSS